jgi:hypothetical protein
MLASFVDDILHLKLRVILTKPWLLEHGAEARFLIAPCILASLVDDVTHSRLRMFLAEPRQLERRAKSGPCGARGMFALSATSHIVFLVML